MDLKEIEENIKTYSDEKLLMEGIINLNDYIPEVKELLNKEIESRKIPQEEINRIKKINEINRNAKKQEKENTLRGFLLFITIILFLDFFIYLTVGLFAIRNIGLIASALFFIIAIICIVSFILILCRKKIVKKIFISFMGLDILLGIIDILLSLLNNYVDSIGKDLFTILKDSLFIMYFVKSEYVKKYLIK